MKMANSNVSSVIPQGQKKIQLILLTKISNRILKHQTQYITVYTKFTGILNYYSSPNSRGMHQFFSSLHFYKCLEVSKYLNFYFQVPISVDHHLRK